METPFEPAAQNAGLGADGGATLDLRLGVSRLEVGGRKNREIAVQRERIWKANAKALAATQPDLWQRLAACGEKSDLRWQGSELQWWRGLTPVVVPDAPVAELPVASGAGPVVCIGFGTGSRVRWLLQHTDAPIVVWDRNPTFLKAALERTDFAVWLASGRLSLAAGADLIELSGVRVVDPVLGTAYADERAWQDGGGTALLVHGSLFVDDVAQALRQDGWRVFRWEVATLPVDELNDTLRRIDPAVVVGINHTHGLAEACAEHGVPLIEWEIDPSTDTLRPSQASGATVWTWRADNVATYCEAGFDAHYLPLAANPTRRKPLALTPAQTETYGVPLAYVGSSMVDQGTTLLREFVQWFARIHGDAAAGEQLGGALLKMQAEAGGRYVLPDLLERAAPGIGARFAAAGCPHRPDAMLAEAAAATFRLRTLAGLGELGLHVWGDPGWARLEGHGVTYRGWAGHYEELTRIYNGAAVHIDVGRLYQLDIVPMRIFDVIAAGGFVLAQHSDALAEVLCIGEQVQTWSTVDELQEKAAYYLAHPEERQRIVRAGRRRVLAEHTISHRLRTMLAARAA